MTEDKFGEMWDACVLINAQKLESSAGIKFNASSRKTINEHYDAYRQKMRDTMQTPDGKLDRHKVAAAMTYAIIISAPFQILLGDRHVSKYRLLNELLAFAVGLQIISSFIQSSPEHSPTKKEIFKSNRVHEGLQMPDNTSYLPYICKSLVRMRLNGIKPDTEHLFLAAHLYYFLELIHEVSVKAKLK